MLDKTGQDTGNVAQIEEVRNAHKILVGKPELKKGPQEISTRVRMLSISR